MQPIHIDIAAFEIFARSIYFIGEQCNLNACVLAQQYIAVDLNDAGSKYCNVNYTLKMKSLVITCVIIGKRAMVLA